MSPLRPFHLAIPVHDLELARDFYEGTLGCSTGRESKKWIDFNFFGHQLVTHLDASKRISKIANEVDGDRVPVPHFGIILKKEDWERVGGYDEHMTYGFEDWENILGWRLRKNLAGSLRSP